MLHRDTRGLKSREAIGITLELDHVLTLACFHSRFPSVFVASGFRCYLCLGTFEIDFYQDFLDLDVVYDLWIVIYLGLEIISLAQWEWSI